MRYETLQDYEASEFKRFTGVRKIESALVKSEKFRLPGKKALREGEPAFEIVLVDATECPVERPKQDNDAITAERRNATLRRLN
jgi:hypothetical protein